MVLLPSAVVDQLYEHMISGSSFQVTSCSQATTSGASISWIAEPRNLDSTASLRFFFFFWAGVKTLGSGLGMSSSPCSESVAMSTSSSSRLSASSSWAVSLTAFPSPSWVCKPPILVANVGLMRLSRFVSACVRCLFASIPEASSSLFVANIPARPVWSGFVSTSVVQTWNYRV